MKIIVTGATGTVGQHVARQLRDMGAPVRAFVRDPDKAAAMLGDGIEVAVGDFSDAASVRAAFEGVQRVFLACAAVPMQVELESAVIDAAGDVGIERIVKLSSWVEPESPVPFWNWNAQSERHLLESGIPSVILRRSFSMALLLLLHAEQVRYTGQLVSPADDARIAMSDPRDVAASAVSALTSEGIGNETYALTGPAAVTYAELAETLSAVTGAAVQYVPVPDDAYRDGVVAAGLPEWLANGLVELFKKLRQGRQAAVTDDIRRLTGREPHALAQFMQDHAAAFQVTSGGG